MDAPVAAAEPLLISTAFVTAWFLNVGRTRAWRGESVGVEARRRGGVSWLVLVDIDEVRKVEGGRREAGSRDGTVELVVAVVVVVVAGEFIEGMLPPTRRAFASETISFASETNSLATV